MGITKGHKEEENKMVGYNDDDKNKMVGYNDDDRLKTQSRPRELP